MKKKIKSKILDNIYIFILLVLVVILLNFSVIFFYAENKMSFLSGLSSIISIVLSLIAIFYTFVSSIQIGNMGDKLGEMNGILRSINSQSAKYYKINEELGECAKKLQESNKLDAEGTKQVQEVQETLEDLKNSLDIAADLIFND